MRKRNQKQLKVQPVCGVRKSEENGTGCKTNVQKEGVTAKNPVCYLFQLMPVVIQCNKAKTPKQQRKKYLLAIQPCSQPSISLSQKQLKQTSLAELVQKILQKNLFCCIQSVFRSIFMHDFRQSFIFKKHNPRSFRNTYIGNLCLIFPQFRSSVAQYSRV